MTLKIITIIFSIAITLFTFTSGESVSDNVDRSSDVFLVCDFKGLSADCELHGIENHIQEYKITSKSENFDNSTTKFLTITGTSITKIPKKIGENFLNLESFRVRKTSVKAVGTDDFVGMQSLRHLSLDSNKISIIYQDALHNLPEIESIFISNNKIEFLHPDLFKNSPKLKSLVADYNFVKILDARLFKSNKNLEWISLISNRLSNVNLDFTEFKNLLYVNFGKNVEKCDIKFDEQSTEENEGRLSKLAKFQLEVEQNCRN